MANAVINGLTEYEPQQLEKTKFVAIFTEDPSDNHGLPFWIGKVHSIVNQEDEEDDEEVAAGSEGIGRIVKAKIAEWVMQTKGEELTGKYVAYTTHGGKRKRASATTSAQQQYQEVPINQICFQFDSLTAGKMIMKADKNMIAFNCEVALRTRTYDLPGVEAFNTAEGYKTMPLEF